MKKFLASLLLFLSLSSAVEAANKTRAQILAEIINLLGCGSFQCIPPSALQTIMTDTANSGALFYSISPSTNLTLDATHNSYLLTSSAVLAPVTFTLPPTSALSPGFTVGFARIGQNIIVNANLGQAITLLSGSVSTVTLSTQYQVVWLIWDGAAWRGQNQNNQAFSLTGDCTGSGITSVAVTCLRTNGVLFGTAAVQNTGASGATIPFLNGTNIWSGVNTFNLSANAAQAATSGSILILQQTTGSVSRISETAFASFSAIDLRRADGTSAAPTNIVGADETLGHLNFIGYDTTPGFAIGAQVKGLSGGGWTNVSHPGYFTFCTTATASTSCTDRLKIEMDGGMTLPPTVAGGDCGAGCFNATAIRVANAPVLTANQSITLSGDVSGTGATAITTTIGANKVVNGMLRQGVARSVIGVTGNGTANEADIQAAAGGQVLNSNAAGNAITFTATPQLGVAGATTGTLAFAGATSGTTTLTAQAAAGGVVSNLPSVSGTIPSQGTGAVGITGPGVIFINAGLFIARQVVTGTSTYTATTGTTFVDVTCVGGGGGSGATTTTGAAQASVGGGGGGAAAVRKRIGSAFSGVTVTIGAGGIAGVAGGANGGNGGNTTFGALITANGGTGGTTGAAAAVPTANAGGTGGVASGGDINVTGQRGNYGYTTSTVVILTASGGNSGLGYGEGGSSISVAGTSVGTAGVGFGSGAGGGAIVASQTQVNGTAGQPGICLVDEYQ